MMERMWMVRGEGGSLYDAFRERGVAAIGWSQLAPHAKPGIGRKQLIILYQSAEPEAKPGTVVSGASQVWRFVNDIQEGDWVVTYSPANRLYLIGKVCGPAEHHPEWADRGLSLARAVQWQTRELPRDSLSTSSKNSLGSTLTLFEVSPSAAAEVWALLKGAPVATIKDEVEEATADPLADIEAQAVERIKVDPSVKTVFQRV
ncbi:restriction endonuclease [Massilia sp.]|uniref:restriction endonuclease n=1 Tax=Massilia sp. TaxID=1882437 RepID=UPI00391A6BC0